MHLKHQSRLVNGLIAVNLLMLVTGVDAGNTASTNRLIVKFNSSVDAEPREDRAAERLNQLNSRTGMNLSHGRSITSNTGVYILPEWVPEDVAANIAMRLSDDSSVEYKRAGFLGPSL